MSGYNLRSRDTASKAIQMGKSIHPSVSASARRKISLHPEEPEGSEGPSETEVFEEALPSAEFGLEGHPDQLESDRESEQFDESQLRRSLSEGNIPASSTPVKNLGINAMDMAQSQLTRSQRERIEKRRRAEERARRDSVSSRGEGPSRKKGKAIDPHEWGAIELSEEEIEQQQALYDSIVKSKKHVQMGDDSSTSTSEGAKQKHNKKRRDKYRKKV
ncbi:hypothetical protein FA13DRAFT_1921385 [Coprinellus micaceus]|uniref:Uncharacterized protein n=1 Tax=Coprinellus micaceus TaxID=71717 RepID=A0A4Y7SJQ0_COPMI|nr:hypothetical protein FA13DRAFT_1921385 [Coprinellus micaceus]